MRVTVWRVVVKVSVMVVMQLCFVCVVVEEAVVVVGARREEQAVERVLGRQVVRSVGVPGALRLAMGREGPLLGVTKGVRIGVLLRYSGFKVLS